MAGIDNMCGTYLAKSNSCTFSSGARATWTQKAVKQHDNNIDPNRDSCLQHAWNSDKNVCSQEKMHMLPEKTCFFSWQNIEYLKEQMNVT